jgi:hypothetical protein
MKIVTRHHKPSCIVSGFETGGAFSPLKDYLIQLFSKQATLMISIYPSLRVHTTPHDVETAINRISRNNVPDAGGLRYISLRFVVKHSTFKHSRIVRKLSKIFTDRTLSRGVPSYLKQVLITLLSKTNVYFPPFGQTRPISVLSCTFY